MKAFPLTGAGEPLANFFTFLFIILTYKQNVVCKYFPSRGRGTPGQIFYSLFWIKIKPLFFIIKHCIKSSSPWGKRELNFIFYLLKMT